MAAGLSLFENARQFDTLTTSMWRFAITPTLRLFWNKIKGAVG